MGNVCVVLWRDCNSRMAKINENIAILPLVESVGEWGLMVPVNPAVFLIPSTHIMAYYICGLIRILLETS